jgi:hypothetical protein
VPAGFGEADGDGLLGGFRGLGRVSAVVLHLFHLFAHELAGLGRWGFALFFVFLGPLNGFLLWHDF